MQLIFSAWVLLIGLLLAICSVTATTFAPTASPTAPTTTVPTASPTPIPCSAYSSNKVACKADLACGWRGNRHCALACKYKEEASCVADVRCYWKNGGTCKVLDGTNPGKGKGPKHPHDG